MGVFFLVSGRCLRNSWSARIQVYKMQQRFRECRLQALPVHNDPGPYEVQSISAGMSAVWEDLRSLESERVMSSRTIW